MSHRNYLLKNTMGFITCKEDEEKLLAENRLQMVLVRCGGGRFACPIQDLNHFISIINSSGSDYVRDVSVQS